jgi:hypothetical protein
MAKKESTFVKKIQSKEREPLLYVAVGKKGVGKTYQTTRIVKEYIRGNALNNVKPRKALIIDVNNEYTEFKRLDPSDIRRFTAHPTIEGRRIVPYYADGRVMALSDLEFIFKEATSTFMNGLLLAEDITKFVGDSIPQEIVGNMCTNRHRDVDIIAHFQGIGKAGHPKIKANMNILRMHPTLDTVERHKVKFDEYTEILKLSEKIVNKRYDVFIKENKERFRTYFDFFTYVDFDKNQIRGLFSRAEFEDIITEYVQENEKSTIDVIMKKKDVSGKHLFNYTTALHKAEQDLFDRYSPTTFVS